MARQTDHTHVVSKVFTAELCAEPQITRFFQQLLLKLNIAERLAVFVPFGWQAVVVFGRCQLHGFQRRFRRRAANDKGDMVWRAGCSPEGTHFFHQVVLQLARCEQRFRFLVEVSFVG